MVNDESISVVPVIRPSDRQNRNGYYMSLVRQIGALRTLSFAVGVMLGLVSAVYTQSGTGDHLPGHPSGTQLALDQRLIITGHRRQPTAAEIDRSIDSRRTALGAPHSPDEYREVQQLYDEIMRQTDPALRP
jgi:hypothetical protein